MLAQYSWLSIPISIIFNIMMQGGRPLNPTRSDLIAGAILGAIVPVTGVLSGLVALFGIPRYGRKGILWPAITGVVLWVGLTALAIPTFNRIQKRALEARARATAQTPAVRSTGATRVEDAELGFSFDLPEGYIAFPEHAKPAGIKHAFARELPGENARVLLVKPLGGTLPRQKMRPGDLPPDTPARSLSLTPFNWRGIEVEGARMLETQDALKYITFQIQIPLRGQAIQLGVGGALESEAEVREIANEVLASLEGQHSW